MLELNIIQFLLGIGLFIFGLRKIPSNLDKALTRLPKSLFDHFDGLLRPYLLGLIFSMVIQSSTLAIIGMMIFASRSTISFASSFAFVLGASVGASLNFWIIGPDMTFLAVFCLLGGQMGIFLWRSLKWRSFFQLMSWLGIIFFGFALLQKGLGGWMTILTPDQLLAGETWNPLKGMGLGFLSSILLQSHGPILDLLTSRYLIKAPYIILGANLGLTLTALVVSTWLSTKAKRLAMANIIIHGLGLLMCVVTMGTFLNVIEILVNRVLGLAIEHEINAIHFAFNFLNSIMGLLVYPIIQKIVIAIYPGQAADRDKEQSISKNLFQLLSNVPDEGLVEAQKLYRDLLFRLKTFEDQLVQSLSQKGVRKKIAKVPLDFLEEIDLLEHLLLLIWHKHESHRPLAWAQLGRLRTLKDLLLHWDAFNHFIQDLSRDELDMALDPLEGVVDSFDGNRNELWCYLFDREANRPGSFLTEKVTLQGPDGDKTHASYLKTSFEFFHYFVRVLRYLQRLCLSYDKDWKVLEELDLSLLPMMENEQSNDPSGF